MRTLASALKRWVAIAILVLLFAAGIAFYFRGEMRAGSFDGVVYAQTHLRGECVAESLAQLPERDDMAGRKYLLPFARTCLQHAASDEVFCAEIPDGLVAAVAWIDDRCAGHKSHAKACGKIYQYALSACAGSLPGMAR